MLSLLIRQFSSICRTRKKIPIHKKYIYNLSQSDFNLLADYIYIKIIIVRIINMNFLGRQYDAVIQPAD